MPKTIDKQITVEPEAPKRSGLVPLLVCCVLALYVSSLVYNYNFSSYDDGVAAEGARLILQGKIPYGDFWTMYSPGSAYVNALAVALLGESMVSLRIFGLLSGLVQVVLLYGILQRIVRSAAAWAVCVVVYAALIPVGVGVFWFTAVLATVYALIRYLEAPSGKGSYVVGLLAGLAFLFRQDAGAYLGIAVFAVLYLASPERGAKRFGETVKAVGAFAVVVLAAVGYFAANGALSQLWECAVRFPVVDFPASRPLPYPVPWNEVLVIGPYSAPVPVAFLHQLFGFYLLPVVLLAGVVYFGRGFVRDGDRGRLAVVSLLVIALALFLMVRVRPSGARIFAGTILSMIAFAALACDKDRVVRAVSVGILAVALAAFVPFGVYSIWAQRAYAQSIIPGRGGLYAAQGHAESLALVSEYVRKHTSASEKIFSGSPAVYFLAGRDPATVYFEPHPCVTDTVRVQRTVIKDMEANHVRYFVRSCEWEREGYFTIEREHQPQVLIDYIEANYTATVDMVVFQVYERRTPFEGED